MSHRFCQVLPNPTGAFSALAIQNPGSLGVGLLPPGPGQSLESGLEPHWREARRLSNVETGGVVPRGPNMITNRGPVDEAAIERLFNHPIRRERPGDLIQWLTAVGHKVLRGADKRDVCDGELNGCLEVGARENFDESNLMVGLVQRLVDVVGGRHDGAGEDLGWKGSKRASEGKQDRLALTDLANHLSTLSGGGLLIKRRIHDWIRATRAWLGHARANLLGNAWLLLIQSV